MERKYFLDIIFSDIVLSVRDSSASLQTPVDSHYTWPSVNGFWKRRYLECIFLRLRIHHCQNNLFWKYATKHSFALLAYKNKILEIFFVKENFMLRSIFFINKNDYITWYTKIFIIKYKLDIFKHYIKYQWYSITNNSTISYII